MFKKNYILLLPGLRRKAAHGEPGSLKSHRAASRIAGSSG